MTIQPAPQNRQSNLPVMLTCLTVLFVAAQIILFIIHYGVSDLLDLLVESSLTANMLHPAILWPIIGFIAIQVMAYVLFILWIWFAAVSTGQLCRWSRLTTYCVGLLLWLNGCIAILTLNNHFYPHSFFAGLLQRNILFSGNKNDIWLVISMTLLLSPTLTAYIDFFRQKKYRIHGSILLVMGLAVILSWQSDHIRLTKNATTSQQPNIILIGIDSVRPDFLSYFNQHHASTPHIDHFLQSATVFTEAYTPLARTFPSWVSILTSQYPVKSGARNNLPDPTPIIQHDTLAKRLQQAGYQTIYATDEKRFSNITKAYGFDQIIGPHMGIDDFILGGLSDFPLTNLLINIPLGKFLFPYNYANRAAAITYDPNTFLDQIKQSLATNGQQPLFLSVHFCVSHWPYSWANDPIIKNQSTAEQYTHGVMEVDKQVGELLSLLKQSGRLDHSLVVLLSDHGTTLGLPNDRTISKEHYQGPENALHYITYFKPMAHDATNKLALHLNISYGQGTDVLSLKQNHAVLAVKGFGIPTLTTHITDRRSLQDIAPSILELLHLPPLSKSDGVSFAMALLQPHSLRTQTDRVFFFESGYSMASIESGNINVNNVIHDAIGAYQINPKTGLLTLTPSAEKAIIEDKQFAILKGDWLLAHYPAKLHQTLERKPQHKSELRIKLTPFPAYYVLVNIKTGQWTIGLHNTFAKSAPTHELLEKLRELYGEELAN